MLKKNLIACREIDYQLCAGKGSECARGKRRPQVLTQLDSEFQSPAAKNLKRRHQHAVLPGIGENRSLWRKCAGGFKPARLIELGIACEICFRDKSEDSAASGDDSTVEKTSRVTHRNPENQNAANAHRAVKNLPHCIFGLEDKFGISKQISARVPCDSKLRKGNYRWVFLFRQLFSHPYNVISIYLTIRHLYHRHGCRYSYISVVVVLHNQCVSMGTANLRKIIGLSSVKKEKK